MPRDGSFPGMSLEEKALRHADEFFTGPEKWPRALKFIAGCLLFTAAMAVIYGWMVIGYAVVGG